MNKYFKAAVVVFVLFILPLVGYYFLSSGTMMRKSAMQSLSVKSELGHFQIPTEKDSAIYSERMKGNRWLIGILNKPENRISLSDKLKKLASQSNDDFNQNILIVAGLKSGESIPQLAAQYQWPNRPEWKICYMAENHIYPFSIEAFNIPSPFQNMDLAILLDEEGQIRNYYKILSDDEMIKLVREYPVFLSLKNK